MSTKTKETLTVISQEEIGRDIFSLWLQTDQMAQNARPGQFLSLYTGDGSKLLPRPISICEIDKEDSKIRLVYRVTGKNTGTEGFSRLKSGEKIEALGPLGNGFPLEEAEGKKVFLIGGGIGIPPMLETAKQLKAEKTADVPAEKNSAKVKTSSVSRYTVDELSKAENEFNANNVIIRTALSRADKDLFTLEEAKEIVSKFKNKEVK